MLLVTNAFEILVSEGGQTRTDISSLAYRLDQTLTSAGFGGIMRLCNGHIVFRHLCMSSGEVQRETLDVLLCTRSH